MIFEIPIKTMEDIKKIYEIAIKEDMEFYLRDSNTLINARSLLAMCLLIGKRASIVAPDHASADEFSKIAKKIVKELSN